MSENCFICSIKPILYYSSFSSSFVQVRCSHSKSKTPTKPSIQKSTIRRCVGFVLCIVLAVVSFYELYIDFTYAQFSLFSILAITELMSMCVGLFRNVLNNIFYLEKLRELQVMLCIAEYVKGFDGHITEYKAIRIRAIFGIIGSIFVNTLPIFYFLHDEINATTLLVAFNRCILGLLLSCRYLQNMYEFSYYKTFLKTIFSQIERELRERLACPKQIKIIYGNRLVVTHFESGFLRKMKKLRKLYMTVLNSFRRTRSNTSSAMVTVILGYYLLLSLMLCIVVMGLRGDIELHAGHYLYVTKHVSYVTHLVSFSNLCYSIEKVVQEMLTTMFKVPLKQLDEDESREVDLLIALIAWEKPFNKDSEEMDFGKHLIALLIVDVVTNCMVVIQLYFWFKKMSEEDQIPLKLLFLNPQ